MAEKSTAYLSYLLRLWRKDSNNENIWHASLESVQTGERHNFATIDELFDFLRERTTEVASSGREE